MREVLLSRRSVAGHLLVTAVVVGFTFLGRWQWDESEAPGGDLQNLAYAFQWWLFCVIAVYGWTRMLREEIRVRAGVEERATPAAPEVSVWASTTAVAPREVEVSSAEVDGDEEVRAWNDMLAYLHAHPRR
ncbi:MAG: hypothetical protein ACYDB7_08255 [Mycobacteriales bacterium]